MRIAGAATVLALGAFIVVMMRRETRSQHPHRHRDPDRIRAPQAPSLICGPELRSFPNARRRWPAASTRCTSSSSRLTAFFSLLIAGLIVFYAVKYRRRVARQRRRAHPRRPDARDHLDGHPAAHHDGHLRLGRERLLRDVAAARRDAEHLRRRQAVDVEVPASRRPARDQRAARAGRPAGEADHDVRGRHPRRLRPGVPREGGRRCPAATRTSGSSRPSRAAITCSAPSTAARGTRG